MDMNRYEEYEPLKIWNCVSCNQFKQDYDVLGYLYSDTILDALHLPKIEHIIKGCPNCGTVLQEKDVRYDYGHRG